MRRPAAFVLGTILGSALLVGARLGTHPAGDAVVIGPPSQPRPDDPGQPAGPPAASGEPETAPGVTTTLRPTPTVGSTIGAPAPSAGSGQPTGPVPDGGSGLSPGTFAGVPVTHKYGTLQVTITVSGGRIVTIVESYTTSLQVSAKINAEALPQLRQEALAAQSADIDTVSGATYTSDAYRASLQSALDAANR